MKLEVFILTFIFISVGGSPRPPGINFQVLTSNYTFEDLVAFQGHLFNLSCNLSCVNKTTTNWYKDSKEIKDAKRVTIGNNLLINNVDISDEGTYTCTCKSKKNTTYIASRDFKLSVIRCFGVPNKTRKSQDYEPYREDESAEYRENETATYVAGDDSMKSPDIVWKIGGKLLKNNSRFVFGEYTILDLYQNNLIECNVGPELVSPEIVKHPLNITVDEGETARFHCVFNYSDAAPVFWLKDTIVLEDLRNEIISNDHNSSLTVHNVAPSDAGSYQCQIVPEKIPIVLSKTALLVVRDANNTEQAASSSDKICKGCSEVSTPRSTSNLDSKMIYLLSGAAMLILLIIAVFFWCKRLKIKSFNLWKANHEDLELKNV